MIYNSQDNKFIVGHNLKELFEELPQTVQDTISTNYQKGWEGAKPLTTLSMFLLESGNAFAEWRYALEKSVSIDLTCMHALVYALKDYVDRLQPKDE